MSADFETLDNSLSDKSESPSPFVDRQWLYVNDQNQGNYSGQVVLNTTSLSNSGTFVDWKESMLVVPLILQVQSASLTVDATALDFAVAMKSGYWQLLHSLSVEYNNGTVVQATGFLNVFSSFKNLTSWSEDDLKCWGKVTGFCPDTHDSWVYNTATASAGNVLAGNGTGFSNNRLVATVPINGSGTVRASVTAVAYVTNFVFGTEATVSSDSVYACANHGLLQRMKWLNFQVGAGASTLLASTSANKSALLGTTTTGLNSIFKAYVQSTATQRTIVFPAIIRMKDVCPLFQKLPMIKGASMTLYLNTNQCLCKLAVLPGAIDAGGGLLANGSLQLTESPTILGGGGTCPFMVSSASIGQGLMNATPFRVAVPAVGETVAVNVGLSIAQTQFSDLISGANPQVSAPIRSVRLYAPCYTLSAQAESDYTSGGNETRQISYEDIFQYQFNGINGDFNILVSNGLPGLKSIVCVPLLPVASNGTVTAGNAVYEGGKTTNTLLSPFASTGGSPDPIAITNFNVQISGKNIFNDTQQYDFQAFTQQLAHSNQVNGGYTTSMASGLIGMDEFDSLYRYYYVDCSRGRPGESGVSKSIQVLGQMLKPGNDASLMIFASFSRSITVNVLTGKRIE